MNKRGKKQKRKQIKELKKLKVGDSCSINGYEIICIDKKIYTVVHPTYGIFDRTFKQMEDWIINGGEEMD